MSIRLFIVSLAALFFLSPLTSFADWDSIPPLRSEESLRISPKPEEADEELEALEEKAEEYGAVERYMMVEGSYYTRNYSFTSSGHGEYQAFLFGQVDRYGVSIRFDYLKQFGDRAFAYEFGGHYYLHPDVRAGLKIRIAPNETLIERQGYTPFIEAGLLGRRVVARLSYQFRDFGQADLHDGELELDVHLGKWLILSPLYHINYVRPGGGAAANDINQGFRFKATVRPLRGLYLYGRYGYVQQDFEAGELTPFDSFRAQEFGGGIKAELSVGVALYFDIIHHDRNNGESFQRYHVGTLIRF